MFRRAREHTKSVQLTLQTGNGTRTSETRRACGVFSQTGAVSSLAGVLPVQIEEVFLPPHPGQFKARLAVSYGF